jgi:hypothetical protein
MAPGRHPQLTHTADTQARPSDFEKPESTVQFNGLAADEIRDYLLVKEGPSARPVGVAQTAGASSDYSA